MHIFAIFIFCLSCLSKQTENRQKTDSSLMHPIAWATACSNLHILLLCSLIQTVIIAMLNSIQLLMFLLL